MMIMMLTLSDLKEVAPRGKINILQQVVEHQDLFEKYDVNTVRRLRYFLAQLAHESAGFRAVEEYASGRAYEGRRDLGNIKKGDGVRYKGRGLIQLTGRYNYRIYGEKLGVDLEANPELAAEFPYALEIALLYWKDKGLNRLADQGRFKTITRRINGGLNGYRDRLNYLAKFKKIITAETLEKESRAEREVKSSKEMPGVGSSWEHFLSWILKYLTKS